MSLSTGEEPQNKHVQSMFARVLFDNSYSRLPENFYVRQNPLPVERPALIHFNEALAHRFGIEFKDILQTSAGQNLLAGVFAGNIIPAGAAPLAQAYSGHQFGHFSPQLGDGRAVLLGELRDTEGTLWDIQLKGSGPTPFSRGGDGRSALGPVIREYIVSEAMARLGVPTTRSLAAVSTGEAVYRQGPLPGGILTRVAASHVRVGTFQFFASRGDHVSVRKLADYMIDRHYPEAAAAKNPYIELFLAVMARQSALVAQWMSLGFIHGVMNTDNMTISGETIDYGPCAFMDRYDPSTVFSSIDKGGRYAYGNQGKIAQWNMARLAESLLPLFDPESNRAVALAEEMVTDFAALFDRDWQSAMTAKLGFQEIEPDDKTLISDLLALMYATKADFTQTFRSLEAAVGGDVAELYGQIGQSAQAVNWREAWRSRLQHEKADIVALKERLHAVNPLYIPRNHLVEEAIAAGVERRDYGKMERLMTVLSQPYEAQQGAEDYAVPPEVEDPYYQTFCGT
ncbi:MAG: hypothetical protein CMF31_07915 [Kordiimonas sp.]|nr:hypothetical protein [Kordiimonas sp.]